MVTERPGGCRAPGVELALEVGAWDSISHTVQPNTRTLELLTFVSARVTCSNHLDNAAFLLAIKKALISPTMKKSLWLCFRRIFSKLSEHRTWGVCVCVNPRNTP